METLTIGQIVYVLYTENNPRIIPATIVQIDEQDGHTLFTISVNDLEMQATDKDFYTTKDEVWLAFGKAMANQYANILKSMNITYTKLFGEEPQAPDAIKLHLAMCHDMLNSEAIDKMQRLSTMHKRVGGSLKACCLQRFFNLTLLDFNNMYRTQQVLALSIKDNIERTIFKIFPELDINFQVSCVANLNTLVVDLIYATHPNIPKTIVRWHVWFTDTVQIKIMEESLVKTGDEHD